MHVQHCKPSFELELSWKYPTIGDREDNKAGTKSIKLLI